MSKSIFESETPIQEATPSTNTVPQELGEFVGEGKKYATVEDALKSVPHAQVHISKLEQELAAIKAEIEQRKTMEQLLDELKSGQVQPVTPTDSTIPQDKIAELIEQTLSAREQSKVMAQNAKTVIDAMVTAFGDKEKAKEQYVKIAADNGLSLEQINQLAETSPNVVLKLAGLTEKRSTTSPLSSTVNTQSLGQGQGNTPSARVRMGATTKDLVAAWRAAGEIVNSQS